MVTWWNTYSVDVVLVRDGEVEIGICPVGATGGG